MTLYLFTASFPYGIGEGFLDDELTILSSSFEHITIVPMAIHSDVPPRHIPANVRVLSPIMRTRTIVNFTGLFNFHSFIPYLQDFLAGKVYKNRKRFRAWISEYLHINAILNSKTIHLLKKELQEDDIIYTYWGRDAYALSVLWKGRCKFVSRFHGSTDLWEDLTDNYKPLRRQIIQNLRLAISVSEKGKFFLDSKYPGGRIIVGRLGNKDYGISRKSSDGVLRVLSCSNIIPIKRVDMIFESLSLIKDRMVEWTHIGSGPLESKIKELISNNCIPGFTVHFTGQLSHADVLRFYLEHPVDVFINLSTIEGIPVTIMEAISFDVPIVATNVGATSEIVNEQTGILLPPNPTCSEVAKAVVSLIHKSIHPRPYWSDKYDSHKNFSELAAQLIIL